MSQGCDADVTTLGHSSHPSANPADRAEWVGRDMIALAMYPESDGCSITVAIEEVPASVTTATKQITSKRVRIDSLASSTYCTVSVDDLDKSGRAQ